MHLLRVAVAVLLLSGPAHGGLKDLGSHFGVAQDNDTAPWGPGGIARDDTVTKELPAVGPDDDDDDYIDLERVLAEDGDDYAEGDSVDDLATPPPAPGPTPVPSDPGARRALLLRLFHGRTRLQRLNVVGSDFGFRLYRSLRNHADPTQNVLLAPAGVSIAMGMMALGAGGATHAQLYAALGFGEFVNASDHYDDATVHKLFRKLTHRLFRRNFGYTLRSVNDLYVRRGVAVEDDFRSRAQAYYFAEPQSVDFSDPAFLLRARRRVQKVTKGLIKDSIRSVDPSTVVMLLNYLYFKGTWEQRFPAELTHQRSFRVSETRVVRVAMMQNKGHYLTSTDPELRCDVLQLPYSGDIAMIVAVPQKLSGMGALERGISTATVQRWLSNMTNRTREVVFPRFKLEQSYDLVRHMKELGLNDLFTERADLSPMTPEKVAVNWFKHQSSITVNEEGTEAAAVTQLGFTPLSAQTRFVVDRPFLFLIYEHRTGCLVFMGRVSDPSGT